MNESVVNKWKKAQESEFDFYRDYLRREGFSRFNIAYKFQFWGFKGFANKSVLEVGSGIFGPIHSIQDEDAFKVGIDPLLGRLYKGMPWKNVYYARATGEALPFAAEKFDVVICYNVLDHVISAEKVLGEIHRVLKRSGNLLLCVNTHRRMMRVLTPAVDRVDIRHPYHFETKDIKPLLENHAFSIVKVRSLSGFSDVPNSKYRYWLVKKIVRNAKWRPLLALFLVPIVYVRARKMP